MTGKKIFFYYANTFWAAAPKGSILCFHTYGGFSPSPSPPPPSPPPSLPRPEGTCYKHLRMDAFQFLHISLSKYLPHMGKPSRKKSSSNFFVHLLQKSKVKWWWFFLVMRWFLATQVLYHDDSTMKYVKTDHLDTKYAFTLQILWRIIWNFAGMSRQLLPKHPWRKQFEGHISTQIQSHF